MFLPVIIPEKRTEGSNDLSCHVIESEKFHGQPDYAEVDKHTTKRDRGKRGKLCKIVPVLIMEIEVFVQDITGYDSAEVRHNRCRDVPDAKICTKNIQQADINKGRDNPNQEEPDHLFVADPVPDPVLDRVGTGKH